jgi:hypothetical protein
MVVSLCEGARRAFVHIERGRDIQQHHAADLAWMIQRQPVRHACAAIVRQDIVALISQRAHQRHGVLRHRALAVRGVIGGGRRLAAIAVAAQIHRHASEAPRERRPDAVPDDVALRMAVQQ